MISRYIAKTSINRVFIYSVCRYVDNDHSDLESGPEDSPVEDPAYFRPIKEEMAAEEQDEPLDFSMKTHEDQVFNYFERTSTPSPMETGPSEVAESSSPMKIKYEIPAFTEFNKVECWTSDSYKLIWR